MSRSSLDLFSADLSRRLTAFGDELQRRVEQHWLAALDVEQALRDEDANLDDHRRHQAHAERATARALWEVRAGLLAAFSLEGPATQELSPSDFEEPSR